MKYKYTKKNESKKSMFFILIHGHQYILGQTFNHHYYSNEHVSHCVPMTVPASYRRYMTKAFFLGANLRGGENSTKPKTKSGAAAL